jgi:hypothetical protein
MGDELNVLDWTDIGTVVGGAKPQTAEIVKTLQERCQSLVDDWVVRGTFDDSPPDAETDDSAAGLGPCPSSSRVLLLRYEE